MTPAPDTQPKPRPQLSALQLHLWRVFDYRRPLPIRRPRFTT